MCWELQHSAQHVRKRRQSLCVRAAQAAAGWLAVTPLGPRLSLVENEFCRHVCGMWPKSRDSCLAGWSPQDSSFAGTSGSALQPELARAAAIVLI